MNPTQPKTVVVKGHKYQIQQFLADDGVRIFVRLAKVAGEPMAKAFNLSQITTDDPKFGDILQDVVKSLFTNVDEELAVKTVADMLSVVIPDGQTFPLHDMLNPSRGNWKTFFQGKQSDLFAVVYESLKVNYEDFLSALRLVGVKLPGLKVQEQSTGPNT